MGVAVCVGIAVDVGVCVGVVGEFTVMAFVVEVTWLKSLSVTVMVCWPGVFRVTLKVPVPLTSLWLLSSSGRMAAASVEANRRVAPYP